MKVQVSKNGKVVGVVDVAAPNQRDAALKAVEKVVGEQGLLVGRTLAETSAMYPEYTTKVVYE